MNKELEEIAIELFSAIELAAMTKYRRKIAEIAAELPEHNKGFEEAVKDVQKAQEAQIEANKKFWEAFKYPLQVFDLLKGEVPPVDTDFHVYDELMGIWEEADGMTMYQGIRHFTKSLYIYRDLSRYHRWAQFPKLEDETNAE